jgi:ribA/ribD-fused uncharacterized protein
MKNIVLISLKSKKLSIIVDFKKEISLLGFYDNGEMSYSENYAELLKDKNLIFYSILDSQFKNSEKIEISDLFLYVKEKIKFEDLIWGQSNFNIEKALKEITSLQNSVISYKFWYGDIISELSKDEIFVFGSNPKGRHGLGAAKTARKYGAIVSMGRGLQGQTYALVTKNLKEDEGFKEESTGIIYYKSGYKSVSLSQISENIKELYECALKNPDKNFLVAYKLDKHPNGKLKSSLNGYNGVDMMNVFLNHTCVPPNMVFHDSFKEFLVQYSTRENKFFFFWQSTSPFSQWHPSVFLFRGITFTSCEQFMMYSKAMLFNDHYIANRILAFNGNEMVNNFINGKITKTEILSNDIKLRKWNIIQNEIKKLGRIVKNYKDDIWFKKRKPIIYVGNREKYNQNKDLMSSFLDTKDLILVEASPSDGIYGIGLRSDDIRAKIPLLWKGENILGLTLTELKLDFKTRSMI